MTDDPTVLYCVGAARAGSTWLHRHLRAHPECHLRTIKELHYFDTLEAGNFDRQIEGFRLKLQAALSDPAMAEKQRARRVKDTEDWISVLERRRADPAAYLAYLSANRGRRKLVADLTPSYGQLSVPTLRSMAMVVPEPRFLFILRDPLARLWSHLRMLARRRDLIGRDVARLTQSAMDQVLAGRETDVISRSDYAGTIARLRSAVPLHRQLVMFQEDLMSPAGLARLCAFLGITMRTDVKFDATGAEAGMVELPTALRERALAYLAPQYEFVAREVGPLPQGWANPTAGGVA